jgi:protein gp37
VQSLRYSNDPAKIVRASFQTFTAPKKWKEPQLIFTCSWSDWFIEQADEWRAEAWQIVRNTPHHTYQILTKRPENIFDRLPRDWGNGYPNVWLGVSVENQDYIHRAEELATIPARVRFISYEPALGPVDFTPVLPFFQWVISGGESGFKDTYIPRPADPAWFQSVRDQCADHGVAYFHKQNGGTRRIEGTWGGNVLDGLVHNEFPKVEA